jgi:hypothetical protein
MDLFISIVSPFFAVNEKNPAENLRDKTNANAQFFFHPDYTVGFGISPKSAHARGLTAKNRITAGGESHPAPKTAYLIDIFIIFT